MLRKTTRRVLSHKRYNLMADSTVRPKTNVAEGIVPVPESAHAIRPTIDEALDAKGKGEKRVILFNLSGHGNFGMAAYESYLSGTLEDYEYPAEAIKESMSKLPQVALSA